MTRMRNAKRILNMMKSLEGVVGLRLLDMGEAIRGKYATVKKKSLYLANIPAASTTTPTPLLHSTLEAGHESYGKVFEFATCYMLCAYGEYRVESSYLLRTHLVALTALFLIPWTFRCLPTSWEC